MSNEYSEWPWRALTLASELCKEMGVPLKAGEDGRFPYEEVLEFVNNLRGPATDPDPQEDTSL